MKILLITALMAASAAAGAQTTANQPQRSDRPITVQPYMKDWYVGEKEPPVVKLDQPISNPKSIIDKITADPSKAYRAVLTGRLDEEMRKAARHTGETIIIGMQKKRYNAACHRIALAFISKQTPRTNGEKPIDWYNRVDFDYCTDGSIPPPALDLAAVAQKMASQHK